jgi:hypothetical protein
VPGSRPPPLGRRLRAAHPLRGPVRPRCARWITVDDTGARHGGRNGMTTQIGDERFTAFRTSFSKSRTNFLDCLRAGHTDHLIDATALAYMRQHHLAGPVLERLAAHPQRHFPDRQAWQAHLAALGLPALAVTPDPVAIATQGAMWGALHRHGLLAGTVVVSDDAGPFRVGTHALCPRPSADGRPCGNGSAAAAADGFMPSGWSTSSSRSPRRSAGRSRWRAR